MLSILSLIYARILKLLEHNKLCLNVLLMHNLDLTVYYLLL